MDILSTSLSEWFSGTQGQYILRWEQARIDAIVADVFGYNAMQVGLPDHELLRSSRIAHRFILESDLLRTSPKVYANANALPIATASLDLVVLPHVLEFSHHPHQILREVERVLVPDGSLVITAFNPFSLFGLRHAFTRRNTSWPWRGHYYSAPRMRDWLTLLGFESPAASFGCHVPPVLSKKWLDRWQFMERAGERWLPICGGCFVLHGIKRVHGMRLIKPRWQRRRVGKFAPAAQRRSSVSTSVYKKQKPETEISCRKSKS